jgi:hypothetical protein
MDLSAFRLLDAASQSLWRSAVSPLHFSSGEGNGLGATKPHAGCFERPVNRGGRVGRMGEKKSADMSRRRSHLFPHFGDFLAA